MKFRWPEFFNKRICEKLIKYQGRKVEFSASGGVELIKISLDDFSTEIKNITDATELAKILDDYQYHLCKMYYELNRDDPQRKKVFDLRLSGLALLTLFRTVLVSFDNDVERQKKHLDDAILRMKKFIDEVINPMPILEEHVTQNFAKLPKKDKDDDISFSFKTNIESQPEFKELSELNEKKHNRNEIKINYRVKSHIEKVWEKDSDYKKTKTKFDRKIISSATKIAKLKPVELNESYLIANYAEQFKNQGYDVKIEVPLEKYRIDLILEKNNITILCEVKARGDPLKASKQLEMYAEAFKEKFLTKNIELWLIIPTKKKKLTFERKGIKFIQDYNMYQ